MQAQNTFVWLIVILSAAGVIAGALEIIRYLSSRRLIEARAKPAPTQRR